MLSSQSGCLSKWPAFVFTDHKRLLVKTVSLIIRRSPSDLMWTAVLAYVTSLTTTIYWNSILLWWPCCSEVGLTINVGVQTPFSILMTGNSLQVSWLSSHAAGLCSHHRCRRHDTFAWPTVSSPLVDSLKPATRNTGMASICAVSCPLRPASNLHIIGLQGAYQGHKRHSLLNSLITGTWSLKYGDIRI